MGQGAMVQGVIDGSGSNGRINGWRKQRLWEQSKEHEWYKRWIKEHNQRSDAWMQAMGQGTIEGTMNGSDSNRRSDGSVSNGRSDGSERNKRSNGSERNKRSNGSGTNRKSDGSGSNRRNVMMWHQQVFKPV